MGVINWVFLKAHSVLFACIIDVVTHKIKLFFGDFNAATVIILLYERNLFKNKSLELDITHTNYNLFL